MNNVSTSVNSWFIISLLLTFFGIANAQDSTVIDSMTIEQCYNWSRINYPISKQLSIIDKTTEYTIKNASSNNLPQINLNGQATYQSAVTEIPIAIPGMQIPAIDKDQYKVYLDVYQPLTNFGNVNNQKKRVETTGELDKQKVEVDFLKLKDRINQIFFGALLIKEKNKQLSIIQTDIDSALVKVQAAIDNGTATITDRQLLQVELISLDQQIDENTANQLAFLTMLSTLTGKNITTSTQLMRPQSQPATTTLNRPELKLFSLQRQVLSVQKKQINNSLYPNVGLFGQGGYGRPALNFLNNDFEFYYLAGIKANWNISNFYNFKNNSRSLHLANELIDAQKQSFLLNTKLTQSQQEAEIDKYQGLLARDEQIIDLRQQVLTTSKVQLENGLITTIDYTKILNDLNKAKQTKLMHETQLLLAEQNLRNTMGN